MTPKRMLAELHFKEATGHSLDANVLRLRAEGESWRYIAAYLDDATDGQVRVTHETLRSWYGTEVAA